MPARHLITGRNGEDAAARYLHSAGYVVRQRNWRAGSLELDLVASYGDLVVFVEVKTRGPGSMARPDQALSRAKMNRLARAASLFLSEYDLWERPCRFDLVCLTKTGQGYELEHMENAFDLSQAVGGGNSTWQPW